MVQKKSDLKIYEFGQPILRQKARKLSKVQINSAKTKKLISHMKSLLSNKKLGVGLAGPQVGKNLALAIIKVQNTKARNKEEDFELVIINPVITMTFGNKIQMYEGCISGSTSLRGGLFAKVPRYKKIELVYTDESGAIKTIILEGLRAQVAQHEVDHLDGILFVDRVQNSSSYITYNEYLKRTKKA